MVQAHLDPQSFENKLKVFSSGLGNIFQELMKPAGEKMAAEAKSKAPRRTGKMADAVSFIFTDSNSGAFTTRKQINKSNVWYSNIVEHGANIQAKKAGYLTFKINGEWKKVKSARTQAKPFMKPVWEDYFGGESGKGYQELANALQRKMNEELN